uniref:(California timema) hypothetical protein n=1 Tax=Timema californicum TaxID=61474 RepID=A0A7R9J7D5_TIMCA|nr:unnamed protein product [Timema californicum]
MSGRARTGQDREGTTEVVWTGERNGEGKEFRRMLDMEEGEDQATVAGGSKEASSPRVGWSLLSTSNPLISGTEIDDSPPFFLPVLQSKDDVVLVPPPPKISRPATPPPPTISAAAPPPPSGRSDQTLSVEETNKLRARLGLKPLDVGGTGPLVLSKEQEEKKKERKERGEDLGGVDMGEFVHKPAESIAAKVRTEKVKEKLVERRERRHIEAKLSKVKPLAESDSDEDTRAWVAKNRKISAERLQAEKRAKMLDQLDAEFGVGELVEDEMRDLRRTAYTHRDLQGLQVHHDFNNFHEGKTVVLTLKDQGVLDEDDDVLVNVNMLDDDRYRKNNEIRRKKPNLHGYDVYQDSEFDEYGNVQDKSVLAKYDEEIDGHKTKMFTIGVCRLQGCSKMGSVNSSSPRVCKGVCSVILGSQGVKVCSVILGSKRSLSFCLSVKDGVKSTSGNFAGENAVEEQRQRALAAVRQKLNNKVVVSLDTPPLQLAAEYYTEQELEVKFKKTKKKFRKLRRKPLKAEDLMPLPDAPANEEGSDLGSRQPPPSDTQDLDLDSMRRVKQEPLDNADAVDVDDLPPLPDLTDVKLEPDDNEQLDLQLALTKARRLKHKESRDSKQSAEELAKAILKGDAEGGTGPGGSIVLNATAEFCRTLGDIPTYGLAGNRDEDAEELLVSDEVFTCCLAGSSRPSQLDRLLGVDYEREMNEEKRRQDEEGRHRGAWNEVEMGESSFCVPCAAPGSLRTCNTKATLLNLYLIPGLWPDETPVDVLPAEVPILDAEPDVGSGVAGALRLAISKGYLEKEDKNKPSASRFAHLQAQNYSIEDKTYFDDDKFGRRERYSGPTSDFKEKETFKPNVKLEYIDDDGRILNAKEAFRYLSHKFHGKGPGKNKVEKRMKKNEQEGLMKQMSSTDTPLGTLNLLQAKQKETQSAFVVLSGSKQT